VNQLYFDAIELLPPLSEANPADFLPTGSRYDAQIICIGKNTQHALENAKLFMVNLQRCLLLHYFITFLFKIGCGAIGCEMLKNYAMLGVSAGNVIDLEQSNSSRL